MPSRNYERVCAKCKSGETHFPNWPALSPIQCNKCDAVFLEPEDMLRVEKTKRP